jgi:hypothetical protein
MIEGRKDGRKTCATLNPKCHATIHIAFVLNKVILKIFSPFFINSFSILNAVYSRSEQISLKLGLSSEFNA